METSCRIYEDLNNISIFLHLSVFYLLPISFLSNLLSGAYLTLPVVNHMPLPCF